MRRMSPAELLTSPGNPSDENDMPPVTRIPVDLAEPVDDRAVITGDSGCGAGELSWRWDTGGPAPTLLPTIPVPSATVAGPVQY